MFIFSGLTTCCRSLDALSKETSRFQQNLDTMDAQSWTIIQSLEAHRMTLSTMVAVSRGAVDIPESKRDDDGGGGDDDDGN
jgi:hypothetical protein